MKAFCTRVFHFVSAPLAGATTKMLRLKSQSNLRYFSPIKIKLTL